MRWRAGLLALGALACSDGTGPERTSLEGVYLLISINEDALPTSDYTGCEEFPAPGTDGCLLIEGTLTLTAERFTLFFRSQDPRHGPVSRTVEGGYRVVETAVRYSPDTGSGYLGHVLESATCAPFTVRDEGVTVVRGPTRLVFCPGGDI